MSEANLYSSGIGRRSLRTNRKTISDYSDSIAYCHHCGKTFSVVDLAKCSSQECQLYFCFNCMLKYKSSMSKKTFVARSRKQDALCLACTGRCLCERCHMNAIEQDLTTLEKLLNVNGSPTEQSLKKKKEEDTTSDGSSSHKNSKRGKKRSRMDTQTETPKPKNVDNAHVASQQIQPNSYSIFDLAAAEQNSKRREAKELMKTMQNFHPQNMGVYNALLMNMQRQGGACNPNMMNYQMQPNQNFNKI